MIFGWMKNEMNLLKMLINGMRRESVVFYSDVLLIENFFCKMKHWLEFVRLLDKLTR